ncbi:MAG: hypothetical protein PHV13_03630 [Candidatus ainarchaeum sp.]|nr:hypothetical protein [Candidatus ainarchaeum sp.]
MTGIKNLLGAFVFLLMAAVLFAQAANQPGSGLLGGAESLTSMVVVQAADATGCVDPAQECVLTATVFAFEPPAGTSAVEDLAKKKQAYEDCLKDTYYAGNVQKCMIEKFGLGTTGDTNPTVIPVQNAKIVFKYITTVTGTPATITGCEALIASTKTENVIPNTCDPLEAGCEQIKVNVYSAQCAIPKDLRQGRATTEILAEFDSTGMAINSKEVLPSIGHYTIRNPPGTAATVLTSQLGDLIAGMAEGKGYPGGTALPCVGVFMILGLLLASLYFAGKSPVSLLDISTPRLPAPKGVAAGGQILLPYGWSEMKGTAMKKMVSASAALKTSIQKGVLPSTAGFQTPASKGGYGDQAAVQKSLLGLGQKAGISSDKLSQLAKKLPYQYGDAEHKTIAEIFNAAAKMGGRDALMAATAKDYLLGMRTYQSLEAITGHKDIGVKSPLMTKIDTVMRVSGLNANRYAVLGGGLTAGAASTVRTGQMMWRGTKMAVKAAPEVAAKTAVSLTGRSMEDLARTSPTAAWFSQKLAKHPSDIFVGTHFPVTGKMAQLYKTLNDETLHDEMRYVLKQLYKKAGVNLSLEEKELVEMGYKDVDILKKCGYLASAEIEAIDAAVRKILRTDHDSQAKLRELIKFAEGSGVTIDHRVTAIADELKGISANSQPEYLKLGLVMTVLDRENNTGMAVKERSRGDDSYVCHVGREKSLTGPAVFETMVLRTMIWDAENGHLNGGLKQELVSARLNVVNRITGLDARSGIEKLPEHMRNEAELEKLAARNKADMLSLFTEDGRQEFTKVKGKNMNSASISEIVDFMYGGATPKTHEVVNGKTMWWGSDQELGLSAKSTLVDVKRHWITGLEERENFALGQWVESRFTKSYVPHFDPEIEARLDRMSGSSSWTVAQRAEEAKKMLLAKLLNQDMENRYNSQFAQNAYGTTHETLRFYEGQMAGILGKVMQDKGIESNHPDMRALEKLNLTDPKSIGELTKLTAKYHSEVEAQLQKQITYDDVVKSKQALVMLHEGGLAYYHKGMMLSDMDRVLNGEVALRDNKGQLRKFRPDDIAINFGNNEPLLREFSKVRGSKNANDWTSFLEAAKTWTKEGGGSYEREKVFAAVLWQYANTTYDYSRFWHESNVSVEAKRQVTPLAPSPLRFFGVEAPGIGTMLKPWRDIGLHMGDYISKVSLAAGGPVHKAAYDIAPISEYYRQHSFQLSSSILSGAALKGLSEEERVAYRAAALDHSAFHQVWDFAIDRNPWRHSTSFGAHQAWGSFFHFGPAQVYSVKDNLKASMDKGQYLNFMSPFYGAPMDLAGKIMRPYTSMIRGMQMSMQGYASKWDSTPDALRQWNYTQPRLLEAMQSVNPFSFKWFPGKTSERLQKLNVFGGSLEKHQLAGADFTKGLLQGPQDIYLNRKGVYASARTGEANPGLSHYNYRHELKPEAAAAEYVIRMREAAFMHDSQVQEQAMTNTVRRTVSAEALAIRRDQELRSFGIMQNPLYGWASPIAALWHMPIPGTPSALTPKDWVANWVNKSKTGGGQTFSQRMQSMADGVGKFLTKVSQPGQLSRVVYCPRCQMPNIRGSNCKNPACRQAQY